ERLPRQRDALLRRTGASDQATSPIFGSEDPRFDVRIVGSDRRATLAVRNEGPPGEFSGQINAIAGFHIQPDVEPIDLPWQMRWTMGTAPNAEIRSNQTSELSVARCDGAGQG